MKRIGAILALLTFILNTILAINNSPEFKLNGTINLDTGTVCLMYVGNERYYPKELINPTTKIVKGKFVFKGTIQHPYAFILGVQQAGNFKYISGMFYVVPAEQNLQCDINKYGQLPTLNNWSMIELLNYNSTDNHKNDETSFLKYAKGHPDSYIVMWKLIDKFSVKNYRQVYDSVYQCLSKKLKSTDTGKELGKYILSTKSLRIGFDFPDLKVTDSGKQIDFKAKSFSDQYTLIDFWDSSCSPCIGQFKELKRIYSLYKKEGFNIVGIALENKETIEKWKNVVDKHKLPWKQYIDWNGFECKKLNINSFPSNFMVNKEGKIVAMNLGINELHDFLEKHIK